MSVGFVLLAHTALDRTGTLARHLAGSGAPVAVHVDRQVPGAEAAALRTRLADCAGVTFTPRRRCEWGTWGIVAATQAAAATLLAGNPSLGHVCLVSGSCLPLRPVAELAAYLAARPETDFIESTALSDLPWTKGGLEAERFSLHFPFAWKRHRRLFDRAVAVQRRFGVQRQPPGGLVPHIGSQWWCLTRATLDAVLSAPDRPAVERYFRGVWIPDESYFQSLARRHARRIESRSLTLSRFDADGRPHVFHDDHLELLRRSGCFLARKIWPRADALYDTFLDGTATRIRRSDPDPAGVDHAFEAAASRRRRGRRGLWMQSRHPHSGREGSLTAAPYSVFAGFDAVFAAFGDWLGRAGAGAVHGHLFHPERVGFAGGARIWHGGLSDSAALRDDNPPAFLANLIWNTRGERQCFLFGPGDRQEIGRHLAADPNARIDVVSGAWAVTLFRSGRDFTDIRHRAATLQAAEARFLEALRDPWSRATVRIRPLADLRAAPEAALQAGFPGIAPPRMVRLDGFGAFLRRLRDSGVALGPEGDLPAQAAAESGEAPAAPSPA